MSVEMRHVRGHVEVFDRWGDFLFSADTTGEAAAELREWEEENERLSGYTGEFAC